VGHLDNIGPIGALWAFQGRQYSYLVLITYLCIVDGNDDGQDPLSGPDYISPSGGSGKTGLVKFMCDILRKGTNAQNLPIRVGGYNKGEHLHHGEEWGQSWDYFKWPIGIVALIWFKILVWRSLTVSSAIYSFASTPLPRSPSGPDKLYPLGRKIAAHLQSYTPRWLWTMQLRFWPSTWGSGVTFRSW